MDENKEDIHRPPSESAKEGDNKPLIEKNTHKPIQKQNTSPRWHISSTFFNATNDNPLFYNYDPNNDRFSEFSEHDDQLLGYLEGIKTDCFFPGYFCWIEKIVLIIDFLQIFGLLWITAQPYPWPYLWSIYTQPINVFNLDFFSLTSERSSVRSILMAEKTDSTCCEAIFEDACNIVEVGSTVGPIAVSWAVWLTESLVLMNVVITG
jgi:hypothetical protein